MFDKFNGRQIIDFGDFSFHSKRFEVWSGGQMIHNGDLSTSIDFKTIGQVPSMNSIVVNLTTLIPDTIIDRSFYFDIAYTGSDRIFVAIIASNTNCESYNSYQVFKASAPNPTRQNKVFGIAEPYVCSIFTINNIPAKITFGLPVSQSLIEFYQ